MIFKGELPLLCLTMELVHPPLILPNLNSAHILSIKCCRESLSLIYLMIFKLIT